MGRSRPGAGLYVVGRVIVVLALIFLVVGCTTPGPLLLLPPPVVSQGSVTSEVTDITQLIATDQRAIRWDYTVVLRETAGVGVQLQTIERGASGDRGELMTSTTKNDFQRRMEPNSELRFNENYLVRWTASGSSAFGNVPGQRGGYRRYLILRGVADDKTPVTVRIDVPLDARTGRRLEPPRVPATLPPVRELAPGEVKVLAGAWRGFYRNPDSIEIPAQLVVREDGSFEAIEGEPVRNRFRGNLQIREGRVTYSSRSDTGTLTLHEAGGRRMLLGSASGQRTGSPGTPPTTFRYSLYFETATPP